MKISMSRFAVVRPALFLAASVVTLAGSRALMAQEGDHDGGGCGLFAGKVCNEIKTCVGIPGSATYRCTTNYEYYRFG